MDRNSILGIIIIAGILIGYTFLTKPSKEQIAEQKRLADSARTAELLNAELAKAKTADFDSLAKQLPEAVAENKEVDNETKLGVYASHAEGKTKFYTLENNKVKIVLSNEGARPYSVELKDYKTWDQKPLMLFQGDSSLLGLEFFSDGKSITTNDLFFETDEESDDIIVTEAEKSISFKLPVDTSGAYIQYTYTLYPDRYLLDFDVKMVGMNQYRTDNVQLKWEIYSPQQEMGRANELQYTNLYYRFNDGEVEKFKPRSKDSQDITETTKIQWLAFKQQFFSSVLISDVSPFEGGYMKMDPEPEGNEYIRKFSAELSVPFNRTDEFNMPMHFYFGPNAFQSLKRIGFKLEELVTIGGSIIRWINAYVVIPIFNFLDNFISNYGIIILLLTLIIKIALLPLTYRSYMSMAKMRVLKPQIDEINQKIPKDKAMERQQATMALYKKVGVNPMGGCLPMILQMPILYAMFRFFPTSIELRQEHFLWAHDLSTYDSILNLPFTIPMYGDHVSLFTILMTVTTIISMKMSGQTPGADTGMPGMKTMMYMMPVMFMLILNSFSAGLTYYYFLANVITIGQNYLFKYLVDEEAILRKLNSKKLKASTGKKSSFQQKLEDMAKQRGYKLPK
ncbi:MAG: membrane protein insertase YidC [Bacteroidales bacterium]|nr:membrane protein insertase YidC [Bacteroidales bacterium]MCB9013982.1 membrane protein insertase YidC [Bacteroidales bacterium]